MIRTVLFNALLVIPICLLPISLVHAASTPTNTITAEKLSLLFKQVESLQTLIYSEQFNRSQITNHSSAVLEVPFYSQFTDITKPGWQGVGCGIASIAMIIDFYSDESVDVDSLLETGISRGAYLDNAGWIHAGLIELSQDFGLNGGTFSLAHLSADLALSELKRVLKDGPVIASVHYTFEPTNPIPHLVVVNRIDNGRVYYNDPAEMAGNGSIAIQKFQQAWKQRYIAVRPV